MGDFLLMYENHTGHVWFSEAVWDTRGAAERGAKAITDENPTKYNPFNSPFVPWYKFRYRSYKLTTITVLSLEEAKKHPKWPKEIREKYFERSRF